MAKISALGLVDVKVTRRDVTRSLQDPIGFLNKVRAMETSFRHAYLGVFLSICEGDHWPVFRDAGIIGVIIDPLFTSLKTIPAPPVMIDAVTACGECFRLVRTSEKIYQKTLQDIVKLAKTVYTPAFIFLGSLSQRCSPSQREHIRILIQNSLEQLSLLAEAEPLPPLAGNNFDAETLNKFKDPDMFGDEGGLEIDFAYCLSLWSWLNAQSSATRRESDIIRARLCRVASSHRHAPILEAMEKEDVWFVRSEGTPLFAIPSLQQTIASLDATPDTLAYCIHFLNLYLQIPESVEKLQDGFERDLVRAIWMVMRDGTTGARLLVNFPSCVILSKLLAKVPDPFQSMLRVVLNQDGAPLMARFAVTMAKAESNEPLLFLVDQLLVFLKSPPSNDKAEESAAKHLILISRDGLNNIWSPTLKHLSILEDHSHPHARKIREKWQALGEAAGVSDAISPLMGCGWYKCPLYEEETDKRMRREATGKKAAIEVLVKTPLESVQSPPNTCYHLPERRSSCAGILLYSSKADL
ncbi:hypothetical protein Hypma_008260 [Hypsizygus marmoreus]|uniref:Uncharacterized protein n=1 Tax=Hypsizygus marmoreus TaxID=39966 RepID=A0A369JVQ0_HYPMA|nr:hypothetical protein Hypma_008260 [Hypsizygus marmoreus]